MPWAAALVLVAIVAPTEDVAVAAIAERPKLPRRSHRDVLEAQRRAVVDLEAVRLGD